MNKRILISLIFIAVLAGGIGYAVWQNQLDKTTNDGLTEEQRIADEKVSEDDTSKVEKEPDGEVTKPGTDESSEQPPPQTEANHSITINSWGFNNNEVYVNAMADDATSGTCTLTLSKGSQKVSTNTPLQQAPTGYYACALRIGRSQVPTAGTWTAQVSLSSGGATAQSQTVEIEVQ